ncbi:unnamed protein product [Cladocopium goreaui]|uniref:Epsin-2 n=1 Tax=Cladocopium goreaui TaxID=2562237 RepID=A0A9P1BS14_9DINO|nr:unnamed protein product [Cladocopium goreaui]
MEKALDKWYGKLKHEAIKIKRQAKAVAELETPFERNLREATSNKRWGCPNSVLHEIALDAQTYKYRQKIMTRALENLNGNQEKWRRILKTLIMLEYLIKNGGDNIADELRGEQLLFRRLSNFQFREDGQDRGSGVREKADTLVKLLNDKEFLKAEREQAKMHHSKLTNQGPTAIGGGRKSPTKEASTSANVISSAINEALNEFRPGVGVGDSKSLSSSQAAELERRFNRLKGEQMAERAAKENVNRLEERGRSSRSPRPTSPEDVPKEDKYGLFDPSFALRDMRDDSDSDRSQGAPRGRGSSSKGMEAAPANIDLLDMDDEPARAGPSPAAGSSSADDWAEFCTPASSSTPSAPRFQAPPPATSATSASPNNLMDFVDGPSPSPPQPSSDFGANFTSFDSPGNFFEAEFQSAPSTAGSGPWNMGGGGPGVSPDRNHLSGYSQPQPQQPMYSTSTEGPTFSGTFLDGMGAGAADMCNLQISDNVKAPAGKTQSPGRALQELDAFQLGT